MLKFKKILEILKQFETKSNFLNHIPLSDIELIVVDLTAESFGIDSEYQLFRDLPLAISSKIERSVHNRRRRRLYFCKITHPQNVVRKINRLR